MITLDASVWISSLSPGEPEYAASAALMDHIVGNAVHVIAPEILPVEVMASFVRLDRFSIELRHAIEDFCSALFVTMIAVDGDISTASCDIAIASHLRGCDSIYAAVARKYNSTLVSLDKEHLTRLNWQTRVRTPAQALADLQKP